MGWSTKRRSRILATAGLIAVAAVAIGSVAAASSGGGQRKMHLSEHRILRIAERAAAHAGDPHPRLIQHAEATRYHANLVDSGDIVSGRQRSYLIAERGHFVVRNSEGVPGSAVPRGSVLTLVVNASTGHVTDFGVSNRYPDLAKLGPVHTDLRRAPGPALSPGQWSVLPRSPLGSRFGATVVWTGWELLELGGTTGGPDWGRTSYEAAAYDVAAGRWRELARIPRSVLPADAASAWTGHQVFMFGSPTRANQADPGRAGLYDPSSNRWSVSSKTPIGPFASQAVAVWAGTRAVLAGIARFGHHGLSVAAYDPSTNTWTRLDPPISSKHPPQAFAMVATSQGVLLWSLWGRTKKTGPNTYTGYSGVDVYRLRNSGGWRNVTGRWPQHQTVNGPIFTGAEIVLAPAGIWCGACHPPAPHNEHGYLVDPATLRLTRIPHGPLDDANPQFLWTGAGIDSLNFTAEIGGPENVKPGDIAFWNPETNNWTRGPRAPKPLADMPTVWGGSRLLVLAQSGALLAYGR